MQGSALFSTAKFILQLSIWKSQILQIEKMKLTSTLLQINFVVFDLTPFPFPEREGVVQAAKSDRYPVFTVNYMDFVIILIA